MVITRLRDTVELRGNSVRSYTNQIIEIDVPYLIDVLVSLGFTHRSKNISPPPEVSSLE